MGKENLKDIVEKTDCDALKNWLINYATNQSELKALLLEKFSPKQLKVENTKDYPTLIRVAFLNNPLQSSSHYRKYHHDGFCAEGVRADLEEILEDISYFLNYGNIKIAVQICKDIIEIIPEEWEEQYDYEGDVQVIYDSAIDELEKILQEGYLSDQEKQELFNWYLKESEINNKHEYIGLNTNLSVLIKYFMSSEEIMKRELELINKKIKNSNYEFEKESFIIDKINILKRLNRVKEMDQMIDENLKIFEVRKVKLENLLQKKAYEQAIRLIEEGITIAKNAFSSRIEIEWNCQLIEIYRIQKNKSKILKLAEQLIYTSDQQKTYYELLKAETPKEDWDKVFNRLIKKLNPTNRLLGPHPFLAEILVDQQKWDLLWNLCCKNNLRYLEKYENYLVADYEKEILKHYLNYVEDLAEIADKDAYESVARIMKRMAKLDGGTEKVQELILRYREEYKRRKNMMLVLDEVVEFLKLKK